MVNGMQCRFFHFSGFNPAFPEVLTRHMISGESCSPAILRLLEGYTNLLLDAGYQESRHWPYAWQTFDNGVTIPDIARNVYRDLGADVERFGHPFDTGRAGNFFQWLREIEPDEDHPDHRVRQRFDVQRVFPDLRGSGYEAFARWTELSGASEHGIPDAFRLR
jgi:hypothetical protein